MQMIHETAIVGKDVKLGKNVSIGAYSVIEGNVFIGDGTEIKNNVNIKNNVKIGTNNKFYPFCSIGELGEMTSHGDVFVEDGFVEIGDNNTIREFVTVNSPSLSKKTKIGSNCYICARSHIPHDVIMGNNVNMVNAVLGGHCIVDDYVFLGLCSVVHQKLRIGESAMIGMGAVVTKNVPPFLTVVGNPAKKLSFNKIGIRRRGFSDKDIKDLFKIIDNPSYHLNFKQNENVLNLYKKWSDFQLSFLESGSL